MDWLHGDIAEKDAKLQRFAEACVRYGFDGVEIHEAADLEACSHLLQRCVDRLRGIDPGPLPVG